MPYGFDGFEDGIKGQEERASTSEVFVSFTNQGAFEIRGSDEKLPPDMEYLVGGIDREVTKWMTASPISVCWHRERSFPIRQAQYGSAAVRMVGRAGWSARTVGKGVPGTC